jgi:hypothetical protein
VYRSISTVKTEMKKNNHILFYVLPMMLLAFSACNNFFGKKTNLDFIPRPDYNPKQVSYVPIQPAITGLQYPTDVIVGWDQMIYVADAGSQQIISYDISGFKLASFYIPGLKSVAQDRHLNLLAIGSIDTSINGKKYTLSAIYRLNLDNPSGYGLHFARITDTIVHPFYYKTGLSDHDVQTSFKHIAVLGDNSFYVTRSGPSNSTTQFGGPDDALIQFTAGDVFITPIQVTSYNGTYSDYFKMPMGVCTKAQPPQSNSINTSGDFYFTCLMPNYPLKVQAVKRAETPNGTFYVLDYYPPGDTGKADGFMYSPFKFELPSAITQAGDGTNYIFVVDAKKDSLYQFNAQGFEGINPPPGYNSKKNIKVSFGGKGTDLSHFNNPLGVAYYNKMVYVADAGNGRILRFKLTTDIK